MTIDLAIVRLIYHKTIGTSALSAEMTVDPPSLMMNVHNEGEYFTVSE
jgi:hypothetical protein